MLYGLAISQSDCRKADPYQLPCNNALVVTLANGLYSSFHLKTSFWEHNAKNLNKLASVRNPSFAMNHMAMLSLEI